jgi:hypothetical protein
MGEFFRIKSQLFQTYDFIYKSSHYEYLATYMDDLLFWSIDPMAIINSLKKTYMLKSFGIPEYYLGGNLEFLGEAWKNQGLGYGFSENTYIQNVIPKFEGLFGKELKPIKTPMSEERGYHPEVDDSPLCTEDDSAKYRSIIGFCIWIIVLGRFDIAYATSAMSRFNILPIPHTLTIPCTLLNLVQNGWNSIQMLVKRFQKVFLLKNGQESG